MKHPSFKLAVLIMCVAGLIPGIVPHPTRAQNDSDLGAAIAKIAARPEYKHSTFGVEVYSLDDNKVVFALRADELFTPASTTKLFTEGSALELLGADYRFHTRIYRTAPISSDGTLRGDLVLVASGDPNLSARIQPGGTLAFENEDHSYDGSPDTRAVPGDPLLVIREFATQIAAHRIKKIQGHILVDATLFPEGGREEGTGVAISPICVNDNVIDLTITPGAKAGAATGMQVSPKTAYAAFTNHITTAASGHPDVQVPADTTRPDASHSVSFTGTVPMGPPILFVYRVPEPSRFAAVTLVEALRVKGITVGLSPTSLKPDFKSLSAKYTPQNLLAEHISPPLSEEVKVTLKVSQNLHASMTPFILGAILGHKITDVDQGGFDLERNFLAKAGLDLSAASQADGAGGAQSAYFTPDFVAHYLAFMSKQKDFQIFENALPILGRDGTLFKIQVDSPAAGHVFAKTGTFGSYDALNKNVMLNGKGLAGYTTTPDGRHLAFAAYINHVSLPLDDPDAPQNIAGQALGEIAAAIYSSSPN